MLDSNKIWATNSASQNVDNHKKPRLFFCTWRKIWVVKPVREVTNRSRCEVWLNKKLSWYLVVSNLERRIGKDVLQSYSDVNILAHFFARYQNHLISFPERLEYRYLFRLYLFYFYVYKHGSWLSWQNSDKPTYFPNRFKFPDSFLTFSLVFCLHSRCLERHHLRQFIIRSLQSHKAEPNIYSFEYSDSWSPFHDFDVQKLQCPTQNNRGHRYKVTIELKVFQRLLAGVTPNLLDFQ